MSKQNIKQVILSTTSLPGPDNGLRESSRFKGWTCVTHVKCRKKDNKQLALQMEDSSTRVLITALNERLRFNKPHRGFQGLLKKRTNAAGAPSVSQEKTF